MSDNVNIWSFGDNLLMFLFLVLVHRVCFLKCLIYVIVIVNKKLLIWMIWCIEWLSLPPKRICICFLGVWGDCWSRIILSKFKDWDSLSVQCCKPIQQDCTSVYFWFTLILGIWPIRVSVNCRKRFLLGFSSCADLWCWFCSSCPLRPLKERFKLARIGKYC